jgi:hypothetical protein
MTRWEVDDQPADPALAHRGQLGGDDLQMPIDCQAGLRVEVLEAASGEGAKSVPQQDVVLDRSNYETFHRSESATGKRALSCSRTFSSASLNVEVSESTASLCASMLRNKSRRI